MHFDCDVVVVGAGVAGLAATQHLRTAGIDVQLVEASHRIGGRAYTEYLADGAPFDLGCHWLHCASINPLRELADTLGFGYAHDGYHTTTPNRGLWQCGRWLDPSEQDAANAFLQDSDACLRRARPGASIADATRRDHRFSSWLDYWMSIWQAADADQVDAADWTEYRDTHENWPVRDGYGALVADAFRSVPVALNTPVRRIDWGGKGVRVHTPRGTRSARFCLLTVSTGVLNAGDIAFSPVLPVWKAQAIAGLPAGNANRIALNLRHDPFGEDAPAAVTCVPADAPPMNFSLRPFGRNHVVANTGGRFAWHLERAGIEASVDYARTRLADLFGHDVLRALDGHRVSAWGTDPWTKCAYTYALPGEFEQRAQLRKPVADRLYFAGEATSPEFFTTCHGAYLSGRAAARTLAKAIVPPLRST